MKKPFSLIAITFAAGLVATAAWADTAKPGGQAFGDWTLRCTKPKAGEKACALHQKVVSAQTKLPVAAFALARHNESRELRLTVILPLGLDIPAGVLAKVGATTLSLTIQTCVRHGCIASTEVDAKLLEALRGSDGFTTTFKMRSVADATAIPVSLKGLDEGLKALEQN